MKALLWLLTLLLLRSPPPVLSASERKNWSVHLYGTEPQGGIGREYFEGGTGINFLIVYILNVVVYFSFVLPTFWTI